MAREMFRANLLHIWLGLVILVGTLPMANLIPAMQTMQMDEMAVYSQEGFLGNVATENTDENSAHSCCNAVFLFSLACAFVIPQFVYATAYGGSERIPYSALIVRSIYLQVAFPPPKA